MSRLSLRRHETSGPGPTDEPVGAYRDTKRRGLLLPLLAVLGVILLIAALVGLLVYLFDGGSDSGSGSGGSTNSTTYGDGGGLVGGGPVKPAEATGVFALTNAYGTVLFTEGSTSLNANAKQVIANAAKAIKAHRPRVVVVNGFTDVIAGRPFNDKLSGERATAVLKQLRGDIGPGPTAYSTRDLGKDDPIGDNSTAAGRQDNRRVTITSS